MSNRNVEIESGACRCTLPAAAREVPNIPENPRGRKTRKRGRKQRFDPAIFEERFRTIERLFAWEDKFRRLLLRFEHLSPVHYAFKTLAYTLINLRHYCRS